MQIFLARAVVLEKDSIEERETRHAGSKFFHRRHSPGVDRVSFSNVVVLCLRPLKKGGEEIKTTKDVMMILYWSSRQTTLSMLIFLLHSGIRRMILASAETLFSSVFFLPSSLRVAYVFELLAYTTTTLATSSGVLSLYYTSCWPYNNNHKQH